MLDPKFIRENPAEVKRATRAKGLAPAIVDRFLKVDNTRRQLIDRIEKIRAKKNQLKQDQVEEGKKLKNLLRRLEPDLRAVEEQFYQLAYEIPNLIAEDVPSGKDETENKVIKKWGKPEKFSFKARDHLELGDFLGVIDTQTAAKVSGSRFGYLKGDAVLLEFALVSYALSVLTDKKMISSLAAKISPDFPAKVFVPVVPPVMIRPEVYTQMARLSPRDEDERYYLPKDDLYLVGSAEHTLGPMHLNQTIAAEAFPLRYLGFSTSFRREAGSYGKDTRGILRVHQFDKLEMESFSLPENSSLEQCFFVSIQEYLMQALKIPYRVVAICTGDMGDPDYRQLDIEAWLPGQGKYRETHTSDLMLDYQSRRLGTKFKRKNGENGFVHMNDATAFAVGRTIIAILENFQQRDGSVLVPEVLRNYVGKDRIKRG
ncbi:MAG: serine--tRNA ligase [Candidatus Pacebacteria bacterium]|nr:serine--tRNA ligase [Candidatus Paceibacterota bacterium]